MLLQHSNAWTLAVQVTFQQGRPFFPSPCNGLVRSDGSAFYSEIAPHYKVHCRFPANQPVSQSYYLGISHTAWSQCLSSLHISSAEVFAIGNDNHMQRYCRMRFFSNPLGDTLLVGGVEGREVSVMAHKARMVFTIFHQLNNYFTF